MRILSRRQKHAQYFQVAERFYISNFHHLLPKRTGVNHSLILFWGPYGTTTKCETKSVLQDLCNSYQAFVLNEGNFWTFLKM